MNTPSSRSHSLLFLFGGLSLVAWIVFLVRSSLLNVSLTPEEKLGRLSAAVLALLVIGLLTLRLARQPGRIAFPPGTLFILAYALPALIYFLPFGIRAIAALPGIPEPNAMELVEARAYFFTWQSCCLAGWQALRLYFLRPRSSGNTLNFPGIQPAPAGKALATWTVPGILTGLGLWLIVVFSFSLLTGRIDPNPPLSSAAPLPLLLGLSAVFLAPFGVQATYRLQLESAWQKRISSIRTVLAGSAIFAVLQFRPLLILPAFLASMGFSFLFHRSRSLVPPILAHTLLNLLMLYFNWQMVI